MDNEETRQNDLNNERNHLKWDDPNPFTNYQVFDSNSDTPESSDNSSGSQSSQSSSSKSDDWLDIFK